MQQCLQNHTSDVANKQSEFLLLENKVQETRQVAAQQQMILEAEVTALENQRALAETELETTQDEVRDVQQCLQNHTSDVANKQSEFLLLENKVPETRQLAAQQQMILEAEVTALENQRALAVTELKTTQDEVRDVQQCLQNHTSDVADKQSEFLLLENKVQETRQVAAAQLMILEAEVTALENQRALAVTELETTRCAVETTSAELEFFRHSVTEKNTELSELQADIWQQKQHVVEQHSAISQEYTANMAEKQDECEAHLRKVRDKITCSTNELQVVRELHLTTRLTEHIDTPNNKESLPEHTSEHQEADDEFEAMLLLISETETVQEKETEHGSHDNTNCNADATTDTRRTCVDLELQQNDCELVQQISQAQEVLLREKADLAGIQDHIASLGLKQSALDTQNDNMSATMHDMQQEINFKLEESQTLASNIEQQHMALKEAKTATSAVETDTKIAMQEELCALQISLDLQNLLLIHKKIVCQLRYTICSKTSIVSKKRVKYLPIISRKSIWIYKRLEMLPLQLRLRMTQHL